MRQQPHAEKQQVRVAAQLLTEMPQPQERQQVPRQEALGQFAQVIVEGFVVPGFDKGAAETANAVGQYHFADRLQPATLIQDAQPDQQRDQTHQGHQGRAQPVIHGKAFVDQAVTQQIGKNHHSRQSQAEHAFAQGGNGNPGGKQ